MATVAVVMVRDGKASAGLWRMRDLRIAVPAIEAQHGSTVTHIYSDASPRELLATARAVAQRATAAIASGSAPGLAWGNPAIITGVHSSTERSALVGSTPEAEARAKAVASPGA